MFDIKQFVEDDLNHVASLGVEAYTLYRKWQEIHLRKWSAKELDLMYNVKSMIWVPSDPMDYANLQPKVVVANGKPHSDIWTMLRIMTHSAHWNHSPGRMGRYYVIDQRTGKYLGVISLGSDFISIGGRDSYIGWTHDQRIKGAKMLNYTAMASSIAPTQPLGYNYTGGKLIALLVLSDVIQNDWNDRYSNERLIGITTTSLYGSMSQYTRLKYWHKCEPTQGKIPIEPTDEAYQAIREWMKTNYPSDLSKLEGTKEGGGIPTHPKARIIGFASTKLKIKPRYNNFSRGVFFAPLYTNTNDFLCQRTTTPGERLFDNSAEALCDLWKDRYATNRINNVLKDNRYNTNILYYDELINLSWEETKKKYLNQVGR